MPAFSPPLTRFRNRIPSFTLVAGVLAFWVLEKVMELPVTEWAFKDAPETRHIGPVAQDFKAAFGLGASDKTIATVDADGVALAAIQGLNRKLAAELTHKQAEIGDLKQRLEKLKQLLSPRLNTGPGSR